MTQKPDNPPAFPHMQWHPNGTGNQVCGMTLSDYLAARAFMKQADAAFDAAFAKEQGE